LCDWDQSIGLLPAMKNNQLPSLVAKTEPRHFVFKRLIISAGNSFELFPLLRAEDHKIFAEFPRALQIGGRCFLPHSLPHPI